MKFRFSLSYRELEEMMLMRGAVGGVEYPSWLGGVKASNRKAEYMIKATDSLKLCLHFTPGPYMTANFAT